MRINFNFSTWRSSKILGTFEIKANVGSRVAFVNVFLEI